MLSDLGVVVDAIQETLSVTFAGYGSERRLMVTVQSRQSLTAMGDYSCTTWKTGYSEATVSNASTGSCRSTGICGRPPGTRLTYSLITGALFSTGISTSFTGRALRRRRVARPPMQDQRSVGADTSDIRQT